MTERKVLQSWRCSNNQTQLTLDVSLQMAIFSITFFQSSILHQNPFSCWKHFLFIIKSLRFVLCCSLYLPRSQPHSISHCLSSPEGGAAALPCPSDISKLGVVVELAGAEREACVGRRGGHVRMRRGKGRLELVGVGGIARLVMWVDSWGREEPV